MVSLEVDEWEVRYLEAAFLELHDAGVVDAGPLGKDEDGQLIGVLHVIFQPENKNLVLTDQYMVVHFGEKSTRTCVYERYLY